MIFVRSSPLGWIGCAAALALAAPFLAYPITGHEFADAGYWGTLAWPISVILWWTGLAVLGLFVPLVYATRKLGDRPPLVRRDPHVPADDYERFSVGTDRPPRYM